MNARISIEVERDAVVIRRGQASVTFEREIRCERRFRSTWRSRNLERARQVFDRKAERDVLDSGNALREWLDFRRHLLRQAWLFEDGWHVDSVGSVLRFRHDRRWSDGTIVSSEDVLAFASWLDAKWPGHFRFETTDEEDRVTWISSLDAAVAISVSDPRPIVVLESRRDDITAVGRAERVIGRQEVQAARNRLRFVHRQSDGDVPAGGGFTFLSAEGILLFRASSDRDDDALARDLNNAALRS